MDEAKVFSLFLVCILLVASYQYVVDEVQDAADADPTHSGKAFMANIMPYLYVFMIVAAIGVTGYVLFQEVN